MKIHKTTYKLVVYSEEPIEDGADATDIIEGITTGDNIGAFTTESTDVITDHEQLHDELLAIGNDGEFFQFEDEEENPREKGDDDGVEYGDPRDERDGRD